MARVEGQCHRRHEQVGFSIEIVMDQGGVHSGRPGDGAQAGALVPVRGEGLPGCHDDVFARVAFAGTPTAGAHRVDLLRKIARRDIHQ